MEKKKSRQKWRHRCREQTYGHQGQEVGAVWWWWDELGDWD